jgi:GT2 family glycosyltransferase
MNAAGIVIVTHNSGEDIGPCLDAAATTGMDIVVVDNASADATRAEVLRRPWATLIANPWNRGFAAAANQGIGALDRPYVLLLNPDAVVLEGWDRLVAACRNGAAVAAGKLVDQSGQAQAGFAVRRLPTPLALVFETLGVNRLWPGNPVNRSYRCLELDLEQPADIEQPAGAFFLLRRDVWRELGGFDERFRPLWFEDVDFCKRVRDAGHRIVYEPGAAARHRGGHSIAKLAWDRRQLCWYDSLLRYAAKHFGPATLRAVCLAVLFRSVGRAVLGIFLLRSTEALSTQVSIMSLGGRYLLSGRGERTSLLSALAG